MRIAHQPIALMPAPGAPRSVAPASVRPVQASRPVVADGDGGAAWREGRVDEGASPGPDYRSLLRAARWAQDGDEVSGTGAERSGGVMSGAMSGAGGAAAPAGPQGQERWRWNSRHDGGTLANLYARMSGELVTLGTRVDAFA